ncbi:hypothetical protein ACHHYP_20808 [Achlya hypogyna]|uniref:Tc1-like transposase DDE domain-containing protein n=1 Tax=Achlya hypogyna TaxID=1202772 RepID=A0A1V9Y945_ACHHY|nr:hypothetical protein ACHHYP_20808 [Achlya hypogyna]
MAEARGHTVVYTPAYHSRLQPLELLWSYVKGRVGQQYTTSTTFADVRARLDLALDSIPSEIIFKCIENSKAEWPPSTPADEGRADDAVDCGSDSDNELSWDECDLSDYDVDIGANSSDDDTSIIA